MRDMPVIVGTAHIPGWRVDSKYDGDLGYNNSRYVISTYVVANDKEYVFIYGDNPVKVPETLPNNADNAEFVSSNERHFEP